jgi:hypothetical protein
MRRYKIAQLVMDGYFRQPDCWRRYWMLPSGFEIPRGEIFRHYRLAFRELGLSIGLHV